MKNQRSTSILPGIYSVEEITRQISQFFRPFGYPLSTQFNTPYGLIVMRMSHPSTEKIRFNKNLSEFLGIEQDLKEITYVKTINTPMTCFIYCDLVDKEQNLLNGKPSTLLQTFDITGRAFSIPFYQSSPQHVLRDVSADKHITNMTLSVRDQNDNLLDFNGLPLQFLIEIN